MIKKLKWAIIHEIWKNELWPYRQSKIEPTSAMIYLGGHNIHNMDFKPCFLGYYTAENLVGVNSGHLCADNSYRSRGLWVSPEFRKKGYAKQLLEQTIEQAIKDKADFIWSYPRKSSWKTYLSVGFELSSDWQNSETSNANAYCFRKL